MSDKKAFRKASEPKPNSRIPRRNEKMRDEVQPIDRQTIQDEAQAIYDGRITDPEMPQDKTPYGSRRSTNQSFSRHEAATTQTSKAPLHQTSRHLQRPQQPNIGQPVHMSEQQGTVRNKQNVRTVSETDAKPQSLYQYTTNARPSAYSNEADENALLPLARRATAPYPEERRGSYGTTSSFIPVVEEPETLPVFGEVLPSDDELRRMREKIELTERLVALRQRMPGNTYRDVYASGNARVRQGNAWDRNNPMSQLWLREHQYGKTRAEGNALVQNGNFPVDELIEYPRYTDDPEYHGYWPRRETSDTGNRRRG